MSKFNIRFIRDTTESADVIVEAATEAEAIKKAEAMDASVLDWGKNDGSEWDSRIDYENVEEVADND